jgi:hypothetical protein
VGFSFGNTKVCERSSKVDAVSDPPASENQNTPYANTLVTELLPDEVAQITAVFDQIGVSHFLEQNPFLALEFLPNVVLDGREVNGWYDYKQRSSAISLSKEQDDFGQPLNWGQVGSVSTVAKSVPDAIQRTLVHELGHHVHRTLGAIDSGQFGTTLRMVRTNAVSNYAKIDALEYFAESFSAYVFHRTELIFYDEFGYGMIERALKCLGLEVIEL